MVVGQALPGAAAAGVYVQQQRSPGAAAMQRGPSGVLVSACLSSGTTGGSPISHYCYGYEAAELQQQQQQLPGMIRSTSGGAPRQLPGMPATPEEPEKEAADLLNASTVVTVKAAGVSGQQHVGPKKGPFQSLQSVPDAAVEEPTQKMMMGSPYLQ